MKTNPISTRRRSTGLIGRLLGPKYVFLLASALAAQAQPKITKQPASLSVSLGASVQFRVTASTSSPPLSYEWLHNGTPIPGAAGAALSLTNVQTSDAGLYIAAVTDANGTVRSGPAALDVDPTFTKVMTSGLVTEKANWRPAAWGDYNNDGYPDVYLHQRDTGKDLLYRNNRDGTFTKVLEPTLQKTAISGSWGAAWDDFDNDGLLDLFIANNGGKNVLLRNHGDGTFDKTTTGPGADGSASSSGVWGDYNGDGYPDLFVANAGLAFSSAMNWFYDNQGDGTFSKLGTNQVGSWLKESAAWILATWVDYDQDGRLDLLLPLGSTTRLYRNLGNGAFTSAPQSFTGDTGAWADYDNDGRLDFFGAPMNESATNVLYHNEGAGTFRPMTAAEVGIIVTDKGVAGGVAWGDYDNDGYQDLFVTRGWWYQSGAGRQKSLLYHNNGDGTFTRIESGSLANEVGQGLTANWVDVTRGGFLDLFITEYGNDTPSAHRLYLNNGNSNSWLCVTCVGTSSPRDGTGAKVHAKVTIQGKEMWQLRLINSGGTCWGGQSFVAHFGLGDATNVDVLRIEWPSGITQELRNITAKQYLAITEPLGLLTTQPGELQVQCWRGMSCDIQGSSNLVDWIPLVTVTNTNSFGKLRWTDPAAGSQPRRFYRALAR